MVRSDLNLEAQIRRFWEIHFFVTPNNFANGPHFFALTQLRATKTGAKICCTLPSYTFVYGSIDRFVFLDVCICVHVQEYCMQ